MSVTVKSTKRLNIFISITFFKKISLAEGWYSCLQVIDFRYKEKWEDRAMIGGEGKAICQLRRRGG